MNDERRPIDEDTGSVLQGVGYAILFAAMLFAQGLWMSAQVEAVESDCPSNSACLSWLAPTLNTDGSPVTDLAGFRLYYGTATRDYSQQIDIYAPEATEYELTLTVPNEAATYFFALTAFDASGNESDFSNEVSKEIRFVDTQSPQAPRELKVILRVNLQLPGGVLTSE